LGPEDRRCCLATRRIGDARKCILWSLTFELRGRRRQASGPALQTMHACTVARARLPAVGAPLERGVRHHYAQHVNEPEFASMRLWLPRSHTARAVAVPRVCGVCLDCIAGRQALCSANRKNGVLSSRRCLHGSLSGAYRPILSSFIAVRFSLDDRCDVLALPQAITSELRFQGM
jgi:hypothetical protein